jgi:hypothetical protein
VRMARLPHVPFTRLKVEKKQNKKVLDDFPSTIISRRRTPAQESNSSI